MSLVFLAPEEHIETMSLLELSHSKEEVGIQSPL